MIPLGSTELPQVRRLNSHPHWRAMRCLFFLPLGSCQGRSSKKSGLSTPPVIIRVLLFPPPYGVSEGEVGIARAGSHSSH
jgi:hypothetical protein